MVSNDDTGFIGYHGGSTGMRPSMDLVHSGTTLIVGFAGNGTLHVTDGGVVSNSSYSAAGYFADATGEVTVSGSDSLWHTSGELYVGREGAGTLNIEAGGEVTPAGGRNEN